MSFRFVPRSAVFGQGAASMPTAQRAPLQTRRGPAVQAGAAPDVHQVALLKGEIVRLRQDRERIVKEANAKLGALMTRVRQLSGLVRSSYGQVPPPPPPPVVDVTPAPAQQAQEASQEAPRTAAEAVRSAEDAIFYGEGDAAFYEGGENDG